MAKSRCRESVCALRTECCLVGNIRLYCFSMLAAVCFLEPLPAHSQVMETPVVPNPALATNTSAATTTLVKIDPSATDGVVIPRTIPEKQPVRTEIAVMAMIPDGDYRMFSATDRCNAWTLGVEYDRHSWGHMMGSQMDYVVEVIPVVILSEPAVSDFWGNAKSPNQQVLYGLSISPFGFRWLWRSDKTIKPYVVGKLGAVVFNQKALSLSASYTNFNIQAAFGLQIRMTDRMDLRVEPFQFFHVSNGYLAKSNPGMDELGTRIGISYYLRKPVR